MKFIREHADEVKQNLVNRHNPFDLDEVLALDGKRRELLRDTEALKSEKNAESKKIAMAKKNGEDAADAIARMREVGQKISAIDKELGEVESKLNELLLHIPNMCDKSVPVGKDDSENPEVRKWGEIPTFDFPIKAHYELGDTSASWMQKERGRSPARVSISTSRRQPVSKERYIISCSTCIPSRMTTPKSSRPTSSMASPCRAPASCRNSRMICTSRR